MAASSAFVHDARFHQVFYLPANPQSGRSAPFKITYADYGYRNEAQPEQERILLFFPPLLGSRLVQITKDALAQQHKIRIIVADRPGVGGTDQVHVTQRMSLWLEAMPALLAHLNIRHVSVAAHSGGTVYALDFILHYPELLCPSGYLALGAPWILPTHTSAPALALVQNFLPAGVVRHTDKLSRLIATYLGPAVGSSMQLLVKAGGGGGSGDTTGDEDHAAQRFEEAVWGKVVERIYTESVAGVGDETVLLLQKAGTTWSDWDGDYDVLVPKLVQAVRAAARRLRVDIFYAEDDIVVGGGNTKGPAWFDQCWNTPGLDDVVEFASTIVKGADHDRVWNLRWPAMKTVFERIGQSSEGIPGSPTGAA